MFVITLATTVPAFFAREKPISRQAKPACMNRTSTAAMTTQSVFVATVSGSVPSMARWRSSAVASRVDMRANLRTLPQRVIGPLSKIRPGLFASV